jgi:hypothetical protein
VSINGETTTVLQEKPMLFGFPFLPTTDSSSGEVFLPAPPGELLDSGKLNSVPLIAGVTSHEGILALRSKSKYIAYKVPSSTFLLLNASIGYGNNRNMCKVYSVFVFN